MALPSTGSISMSQVRTELGRSNTITLNDSDVRNLAGRTSGTISMSDLRGKSSYTHQLTVGNYYSEEYGYSAVISYYGNLSPKTINGIGVIGLYSSNGTSFGHCLTVLMEDRGLPTQITVTINNIALPIERVAPLIESYSVSEKENPGYASQLRNIFTYLKNNLGKTIWITIKA